MSEGKPLAGCEASPGRDRAVLRHAAMRIGQRLLQRIPLPGVIDRVETSLPLVALTFDDGPDPEYTPPLLDLLARHGARATFFVQGAAVMEHPEIVRRAAELGHAIGNHTWSHPVLPRTPGRVRREEMRSCQRAIGRHASRPFLFRPPYLAQSKASRLDALFLGLKVVMCSVDSDDWWLGEPDEILERLAGRVGGGDIVLLHDRVFVRPGCVLTHPPARDRSAMLSALGTFLAETRGRLRFVTVPELLRAGRPVRRQWLAKGPAEGSGTAPEASARS